MIEVKGIDREQDQPLILSFDGRVFEIFGWLFGKIRVRRYHVDHIRTFEIQERKGNPRIFIELVFEDGAISGYFEYKSGGENIYELVEEVNQKMTYV